jgi:sulfopropanediol 3-dehydrogenase
VTEMAIRYLKQKAPRSSKDDNAAAIRVAELIAEIEATGEVGVRRLAQQLDGWVGEIVVSQDVLRAAEKALPESIKEDIRFAHARVHDFALHQRDAMREFEVELIDGLITGQRLIPIANAGCYVPGGRYAHVASAIMSVCTARAAGVDHISAATPPVAGSGIEPAVLYALALSGADTVLALGGVQAIAALAFGLFTGRPTDIVVGPGNRYVAEAKRILFGRVGIDIIAGPTESMIIADEKADAAIIAADLAGQAEHGPDSPVWLVSLSSELAAAVAEHMPSVIAALPEEASSAAGCAWRDHGEVVVVDTREEACEVADRYAPEHLHVQAQDLDWWLTHLHNYGSLFLGEETTVAFGDKCAGPNHILPTRGAARYTGGLSVAKFLKMVTYQRLSRAGGRTVAPVAARISRLEGMEGHAKTADIRLEKYFPGEAWPLAVGDAHRRYRSRGTRR